MLIFDELKIYAFLTISVVRVEFKNNKAGTPMVGFRL